MKPLFHVADIPRMMASKILLYLSSIRIWEALFATPFAFIGMILAADGWPGWHSTLWIVVALLGVRTVGMSANRLIHANEDAINPRTSNRHLPQGMLTIIHHNFSVILKFFIIDKGFIQSLII